MALTETEIQAAEGEFMREVAAYAATLLARENSKNESLATALQASARRLSAATFTDRAPSQAEREALVSRLFIPNDPRRGRDDQPPGNR
jgi:hypothetical protein